MAKKYVSNGAFFDQYKSPMWQKRRLEVLESANWECQDCGDSKSQMHVHHRRYISGRKVWEYANHELMALCDSCHERTHTQGDRLKELISKLESSQLDFLIGYAEVFAATNESESGTTTPDESTVTVRLENLEQIAGAADCIHIDDKVILDIAMSGDVLIRDLWRIRLRGK